MARAEDAGRANRTRPRCGAGRRVATTALRGIFTMNGVTETLTVPWSSGTHTPKCNQRARAFLETIPYLQRFLGYGLEVGLASN